METESIHIRMGQVSKGSGSMMSPEMVTGPLSIQMEVSFMVSAPFNTQYRSSSVKVLSRGCE